MYYIPFCRWLLSTFAHFLFHTLKFWHNVLTSATIRNPAMKKVRTIFTCAIGTTLVFLIVAGLGSCKQSKPTSPEAALLFESVIPRPVSATPTGKTFSLKNETKIMVDATAVGAKEVAQYLAGRIGPATGFLFSVEETTGEVPDDAIYLTTTGGDAELGEEGYEITIDEDQLKVVANSAAGLFYSVQTIRQLLPEKVELTDVQEGPWDIATGTIRDYPEFGWRGSMLDVSRHFFGVDDVRRYIDLITAYKMNVLHLHLSDDQGWRIEIKSWPNLAIHGGSTQVGGGKGGYYTQEQYADIVRYASERFVTIVPEIDLPGHINAALASYGELNPDGKPTELYTGTDVGFSTLRIDREVSFEFVDDVMRELAALTPTPYLHIGGDEAHVTKKEDYIAFVNRFAEIVKSHGKRMIGWEDIAQADLDSNAVAQHWHSNELASEAASKGAKIILSPATRVYIDMQYDSTTKLGLHWAAYIEVDDAYDWSPETHLDGVPRDLILGVETPLWTETITTMDDIEYMVFPRLTGIAEVAWTPASQRGWDNYKVRLGNHAKRMQLLGINYYESPLVPWVK
jgi:hexosaminidase